MLDHNGQTRVYRLVSGPLDVRLQRKRDSLTKEDDFFLSDNTLFQEKIYNVVTEFNKKVECRSFGPVTHRKNVVKTKITIISRGIRVGVLFLGVLRVFQAKQAAIQGALKQQHLVRFALLLKDL